MICSLYDNTNRSGLQSVFRAFSRDLFDIYFVLWLNKKVKLFRFWREGERIYENETSFSRHLLCRYGFGCLYRLSEHRRK